MRATCVSKPQMAFDCPYTKRSQLASVPHTGARPVAHSSPPGSSPTQHRCPSAPRSLKLTTRRALPSSGRRTVREEVEEVLSPTNPSPVGGGRDAAGTRAATAMWGPSSWKGLPATSFGDKAMRFYLSVFLQQAYLVFLSGSGSPLTPSLLAGYPLSHRRTLNGTLCSYRSASTNAMPRSIFVRETAGGASESPGLRARQGLRSYGVGLVPAWALGAAGRGSVGGQTLPSKSVLHSADTTGDPRENARDLTHHG